jgi:adenylate kinase family enzyme
MLSEAFGFLHVSAGDLLRAEVHKKESAMGSLGRGTSISQSIVERR